MRRALMLSLLTTAAALGASARNVSNQEAQWAAQAWVHRGKTLGVRFPSSVALSASAHTTTNNARFFAVKMTNGGTVFLSGDTALEPVLCFTAGTNDFSTIDHDSPLWALLENDLAVRSGRRWNAAPTVRVTMAAANQEESSSAQETSAQEKAWEELIAEGEELDSTPTPPMPSAGVGGSTVGDVRVGALVASQWWQGVIRASRNVCCFNYYTPSNAPCGCVATAMAQIMRYWKYPTSSVTPVTQECSWDGESMMLTMQGGTYDWDAMTLVPDATTSLESRQAIGKLTSDCGISVGTDYSLSSSGQSDSGATAENVTNALTSVFGYANARWHYGSDGEDGGDYANIDASLYPQLILANMDAGCPVLMSIGKNGWDVGHSVVGDGYGYSDGTLYVHINMGKTDPNDLWYNLPSIGKYSVFRGVAYNIFPTKTGEIVSGRLTGPESNAVANATVTIREEGASEPLQTVTSSSSGIYAFIVPGGKAYEVVATAGDLSGKAEIKEVPTSGDQSVGNSWGNDIQLAPGADATDEADDPIDERQDPLPTLVSPSSEEVKNVMARAEDPELAEKVTTGEQYASVAAWSKKVRDANGDLAGSAAVMASKHAWFSYAIASETLVTDLPTSDQIKIEQFASTSAQGAFDFTVSVEGLKVGSDALAENLKQVFGIEGGASPEALSPDTVNIVFGTPENGKVKFTATSKDDRQGAFFMRVKVSP